MKYWVLQHVGTLKYYGNQETHALVGAYKYYDVTSAYSAANHLGGYHVVEIESAPQVVGHVEDQLRKRITVLEKTVRSQKRALSAKDEIICERKRQLETMGYVWAWKRDKGAGMTRAQYDELVDYVRRVGRSLWRDNPDMGMRIDAEEQTLTNLQNVTKLCYEHWSKYTAEKKRAARWKKLAKKLRSKKTFADMMNDHAAGFDAGLAKAEIICRDVNGRHRLMAGDSAMIECAAAIAALR